MDRWIPHLVSFKVLSSKSHEEVYLVHHIKTASGSWNGPLINEIFMEEDARAILSIPTNLSSRDDSFYSHFTKYGEYSVSFGYEVCAALDILKSTSGSQGNGFCWNRIWALELPPKIKIFIWRACNSWISTQVNLAKRKVLVSGVCPVCSSSFEATIHALWSCSKLKAVRSMFGVTNGWNQIKKGCFLDFFGVCMTRLKEEDLRVLCVVFWRICLMCNQLVHGGRTWMVEEILPWSKDFVEEFQAANIQSNDRSIPVRQQPTIWTPPGENSFKLNTDAALDSCSSMVGLGLIIQNYK
ncbi:hypothetical protein LWI29_035204 [Acer saccharum]|uniref:Reverse transcriptase zinc-binding domain-containing protein n=1 Tax=Acer saccharum TaxID=4024 RepID=A0AA39RP80_ACESA|nr:hypothetical protein LWI29_035204 [Acer saccharum]